MVRARLRLRYHDTMNVETLREFLRRQPFEPFSVRLTNGEAHEICHPEWAILQPSRLIIGHPDDRMVICSLPHIASVHSAQSV
jgi:hypothetical protein